MSPVHTELMFFSGGCSTELWRSKSSGTMASSPRTKTWSLEVSERNRSAPVGTEFVFARFHPPHPPSSLHDPTVASRRPVADDFAHLASRQSPVASRTGLARLAPRGVQASYAKEMLAEEERLARRRPGRRSAWMTGVAAWCRASEDWVVSTVQSAQVSGDIYEYFSSYLPLVYLLLRLIRPVGKAILH